MPHSCAHEHCAVQMKRLLGILAANKHIGDVEDAYHFALGLDGYKTLAAASPRTGLVVASVTPAILLSGKVCSVPLTCPCHCPTSLPLGKSEGLYADCRSNRIK